MSVSTDVSSTPITLYCNETPGDSLCSNNDDDISEINSMSSTDFPADIDESYIDNILLSELHQTPATELITQFLEISEVGSAHQDALNWMLKVHASYRFRPETAYLSVNYFHCFMLSPRPLQPVKGWPLQLLAVACLSLAAKMEETRVPVKGCLDCSDFVIKLKKLLWNVDPKVNKHTSSIYRINQVSRAR